MDHDNRLLRFRVDVDVSKLQVDVFGGRSAALDGLAGRKLLDKGIGVEVGSGLADFDGEAGQGVDGRCEEEGDTEGELHLGGS